MSNKFSDDPNRFAFGENWTRFLAILDDERITEAERSLKGMLNCESLEGKTFLDIGSGSGLFSLAARRLGAKVHSLDYDSDSVACTSELKHRYYAADTDWVVEQASALDVNHMKSLGQYDVVYSWGVLHHTGAMWLGIENALQRVAHDGSFYIPIYNDQGLKSHFWWLVKYLYNKLPRPLNTMYAYALGLSANIFNILKYTTRLSPMTAIRPLLNYQTGRGMSVMRDLIDWMGGYPFEFARYDVLQHYIEARGFRLVKGIKATSLGCHQMVFESAEEK